MFSACLTCKQARKPKECGAGYAYCLLTRKYVEVMALCPDFSHIAQKTPAVVGSAPVLSGSGNSQLGVLLGQQQDKLNRRLTLVSDVPPPYNNRGTSLNLRLNELNFSQCEISNLQESA
jgi:hypothetical protein